MAKSLATLFCSGYVLLESALRLEVPVIPSTTCIIYVKMLTCGKLFCQESEPEIVLSCKRSEHGADVRAEACDEACGEASALDCLL